MAKAPQKLPFMKWFYADIRAEKTLKFCSWEARYLWREMLEYMHESEKPGFLLYSEDQLCELIHGATPERIRNCLFELETHKVFSRDRNGIIYCRKMVRDAKRAEVSRKNGRRGGNPDLKKNEKNDAKIEENHEIEVAVSPEDIKENQNRDNQTLVYPDARGQKPDVEKEDNKLSSKKGAANRGCRLPENWELVRSLGEWAMDQGLSRDEVIREAEKFKNYWHSKTGKDATKKDWDKTFKNWIFNSLERKPKNGTRFISRSEQADAAIQRGFAKLEAGGADDALEEPAGLLGPPSV